MNSIFDENIFFTNPYQPMHTLPKTVHYTVNQAIAKKLQYMALPMGWGLETIATTHEQHRYYDTFNWHGFTNNVVIVTKRKILFLLDLITGVEIASLPCTGNPPSFFATSLPDSTLKEHLLSCSSLRAFIKRSSIDVTRYSYRLLDDHQKTIAFVQEEWLQRNTQEQIFLRVILVSSLKGYEDDGAIFINSLKANNIVDEEKTFKELIELTLQADGCRVNNYSAKIALQLDGKQPIHISIKHLLKASLTTMRLNEAGIKQNIDTEFLHDYRVALRRTRSLLKQLRSVMDSTLNQRYQLLFKELGKRTNALRDADVYLLKEQHYTAILPPLLQPALTPLFRSIETSRKAAHRQFCRYLSSPAYHALLQEWSTFLEQTMLPNLEDAPNAEQPTLFVAVTSIHKAWKRLLRHGRQISKTASPDELHALRIDCKKLRYLLEFFASLFSSATISLTIQQLKSLQDTLGDYVDCSVQIAFLHKQCAIPQQNVLTTAAFGGLMTILYQQQETARCAFHKTFRTFDDNETHLLFHKLLSTSEQ